MPATDSRSLHTNRLPVDAVGALAPLPGGAVLIDPSSYWGRWQSVNGTSMISHCSRWMRRVGWVGNLEAAAAAQLPQARRGREFTDSDVYKLVEAMSWEQGRAPTDEREAEIHELTSVIAAAQESDGYINTNFGRPGQAPRYSDLEWGSELYCLGHLLQAAVARERTAGRDALFDVATRAADHICETFGPSGIQSVGGHPEVELGLLEFARVTGVDRYRQQAALFLERRGHGVLADIEFGREYFQDDMPIRDATVMRGHAVRAVYLNAAAVDLAIDTGDTELLAAVERQWENTLAARTYITGGMGSHHQDEAFGEDYELPADRAYCETCAGVGAFMLGWRLLLATGRSRYADMMERVLFNVIATSPAEDGRAFFYANTLHQRVLPSATDPDEAIPRASSGMRAPWFAVSCCPTNVSRTFSTLDAYVATADAEGVRIALYTSGTINAALPTGGIASVRVETDYPATGRVVIHVGQCDEGVWDLRLRVPDWARGATVERSGTVSEALEPGWALVPGVGSVPETVVLTLPAAPRFTFGDRRIDAARGAVAVERGPLVYCLESVDFDDEGLHVDDFLIDTGVQPWESDGDVLVRGTLEPTLTRAWPYGGRVDPASARSVVVRMQPYSEWGRRGPSTMRVWVRCE